MTGFEIAPITVWYCSLRPGTARAEVKFLHAPITTTLQWPTDQITLCAGGYEGNISSFLIHIELRIKHFESQL